MFTLPYRTLFHQKRWATNGLRAVIAENAERLPVDDQVVICRLLDHIQVVDDIFRIFRHNLEATAHGYAAPARPSSLRSRRWRAAPVAFSFANGAPARMTRGEMLLHVALHAAGHRGQAALLLQKNGIQQWPDRITDFLSAGDGDAKAAAA
jgi:hypothetical protein